MKSNFKENLAAPDYVILSFGGGVAIVRSLKEEGVTVGTTAVSHWKSRGRIPLKYWIPLLKSAEKKGILVTAEHLLNGGTKWAR